MKINNIYKISCIFLVLAIFTGCEEDVPLFDISQKDGIYFKYFGEGSSGANIAMDSAFFSFGYQPGDLTEYNIPIAITGQPNSEDRNFTFEVEADSTTAVEDLHYSFGETIIKAGEVEGVIPVTFYRKKDSLLLDSIFVLSLKLLEDDNFRPDINGELELYFTDGLSVAPDWWYPYYLGTYSQGMLIKLFEHFRALEDINPQIYNQIIEEFGFYFEDAPYGGILFAQHYKAYMIKYVLIPLYDYYQENPTEGVNMPDPRTRI